MKRFYKTVSIKEIQDKSTEEKGFAIQLDTKLLKTPKGKCFVVQDGVIAKVIAKEWESIKEGGDIVPQKMKITQLLNKALDEVESNEAEIRDTIVAYAMHDLLCYRCGDNVDLRKEQDRAWDPWHAWAREYLDMNLRITEGIIPVVQSGTVKSSAMVFLNTLNVFCLTIMVELTNIYGSFILAAAVLKGYVNIVDAFAISRIDEVYQMNKWGMDTEVKYKVKAQERYLLKIGEFLQILEI